MHDDEEIEFDGAVVTQAEPPAFVADLDAAYGEDEEIEPLDDLDLDERAPPAAPTRGRARSSRPP